MSRAGRAEPFGLRAERQAARGHTNARRTIAPGRLSHDPGDQLTQTLAPAGEPAFPQFLAALVQASRTEVHALGGYQILPGCDLNGCVDGDFVLTRSLRAIVESRIPEGVPSDEERRVIKRVIQFMEGAQRAMVGIALDHALASSPVDIPVMNPTKRRDLFAPLERSGVRPEERIAYRIDEVSALAGVSPATVRKHIGTNIEARKVRGMVLLNPEDVHRTFGFTREASITPSAESLAEIEELLT